MKRWKNTRTTTIVILIIFVLYLLYKMYLCTKMSYPHDSLGVTMYNWFDQFQLELAFIAYIFGIPMIVDITLLILSIIKIKKQN